MPIERVGSTVARSFIASALSNFASFFVRPSSRLRRLCSKSCMSCWLVKFLMSCSSDRTCRSFAVRALLCLTTAARDRSYRDFVGFGFSAFFGFGFSGAATTTSGRNGCVGACAQWGVCAAEGRSVASGDENKTDPDGNHPHAGPELPVR